MMLSLAINYESSWRNSFLAGDNNSPQKGARKYLASIDSLGKEDKNYIEREITHDTVMGVLNRLIGDQRKLYQSRTSEHYVLKDIDNENSISFNDEVSTLSDEVVFLSNISKSTDKKKYSGAIELNGPAFSSSFSGQLWGLLHLDFEGLCDFIIDNNTTVPSIKTDPVTLSDHFENTISKIKMVKVDEPNIAFFNKVIQAEAILNNAFSVTYRSADDKKIYPGAMYCGALYLQAVILSKKYDLSPLFTKAGNISGFSKRGFTPKDFIKYYAEVTSKLIYGNPYFKDNNGHKNGLKKASGVLYININTSSERALAIKTLIDDAGVMSFKLGKKGLAYISTIKAK